MVNTEDFIKRLEKILDYYSLTASSFADKIGVQRSSMSHLLSGRNKPSLDFVMKILEVFPEVDLYWILNGKGNFPKDDTSRNIVPPPIETLPPSKEIVETEDLFSSSFGKIDPEKPKEPFRVQSPKDSEVEKIVIFYTDGTFKEYNPK